jgi:D-glycero-alpha-D-manno-heptose-7-phosphate kinase
MIMTKTPFRVSLFGGGSDLEAFYMKHFGSVLSFSINKYMYISSHNFFEKDKIRIKYSRTETVNNAADLQHPILREVLMQFKVKGGLEVSSIADIPSGTGMGSSSAFTVGLLHNLYARHHQFTSKKKLAEEACDIEINKIKEPIGKQDQYAAAFGGLNVFKFHSNGHVDVDPVHLDGEKMRQFQSHLHLFYTGTTRSTSSVLSEQKNNMSSQDKFEIMKKMVESVEIGKDLLYQSDWKAFGELLHQNWLYKKQMASKISNPEIDESYEKGLAAGAWGGKLLGAGGGGFLLFFAPPEKAAQLKAQLGLREFPFKIEHEGSKVIYFDEDSTED